MRSRLRLLLLLFATATFFACGPGWEQTDETERRPAHLAAGESTDARMSAEGSWPPKIELEIQELVAPHGKLAIEIGDTRPSCYRTATYTNDGGIWRSSRPNEHADADRIRVLDTCASLETTGTVTIHITNESAEPVDFVWFGRAKIGGNNADPPAGAFVKIELAD